MASNPSKIDSNQVLPTVYDAATDSLRITGSGKLVTESFDYIAATYPTATTEVYTYKTGGSGGTTVATVTVTYVDATKEEISSVEKA